MPFITDASSAQIGGPDDYAGVQTRGDVLVYMSEVLTEPLDVIGPARLIAHVIGRARRCVGLSCTEGIYVAGARIEKGDCSGPVSAQTVLQHPEVEAAVTRAAQLCPNGVISLLGGSATGIEQV